MKTLRRRFLKLGMLLGGSALLWSCVAPILTVPPPNEIAFSTEMITDSSGAPQTEWIASGGPLPQAANADYYVFNRTQGQGVIASAKNDGSFTAPPMQGNTNDQVLIYYKTPFGDYSDSLCVLLVAGVASGTCQ
ncbi:MAG TPA: hypothetical protein VKZ18_02975 [Polyangia bacterium]|nr:hypothetical protein [Polyangia bacterium]